MSIKPILNDILPFDSTFGASLYFNYTGANQTIGNNLVIKDVETGDIVYDYEYITYERIHLLPPSILENGSNYICKVRVKFIDGTYSEFSNSVSIMTLERPILDIISIDGQGRVYNQNITFVATYYQANAERVRFYQFVLYDENDDLIMKLRKKVPENQNEFRELVTGLEKTQSYYIEVRIETVNGMIYSHKEKFIPFYIVPSINGVVNTHTDTENGFIRINANVKQIIGNPVSANNSLDKDETLGEENEGSKLIDKFEYIDNDWIIIPKDKGVAFEKLGMNRASDFIMKIWFKNIPDGKLFLVLSPVEEDGVKIKFYKHKDKIIAYKTFSDSSAIYSSNILPIVENKAYMLGVRNIEFRMDLILKEVI